jgi:UDP-glucose 4,6-dehydratase
MSNSIEHKQAPYVPNCVLLTGGAGFIGSAVLLRLVNRYPDCRFICLDNLSYMASEKSLDPIKDKPNFKFVRGSITSFELVVYLLRNELVDTVMHFAAQTHVGMRLYHSNQLA